MGLFFVRPAVEQRPTGVPQLKQSLYLGYFLYYSSNLPFTYSVLLTPNVAYSDLASTKGHKDGCNSFSNGKMSIFDILYNIFADSQ